MPSKKGKSRNDKKSERKHNLASLKKELEFDHHIIPLERFYERFKTDPIKGLRNSKAKELLERDGRNALTHVKETPEWLKFCKHLFGGFALLLWIGAFLCLLVYLLELNSDEENSDENLYLSIVLIAVVIINGVFTYYQDSKSSRIMESFQSMVPLYANVVRDGERKRILAEELVVGDVIELKLGDCIPADARIIEAQNFKVDNSSLTGESDPQPCSVQHTHRNPLASKNLVFFSTNAVEGIAKAVVISCGDKTAIGRIAALAVGLESVETPIAREIRRFIYLITGVAQMHVIICAQRILLLIQLHIAAHHANELLLDFLAARYAIQIVAYELHAKCRRYMPQQASHEEMQFAATLKSSSNKELEQIDDITNLNICQKQQLSLLKQ